MIVNKTVLNINEFIPENFNQKCGVIVTHGIAEYSKNYQEVAQKLSRLGIYVLIYDLRGHGLSLKKRGYIKSYKTYLDDLAQIVNYVKSKCEKVFLLGHSLGGIISNLYALKYNNIDGLIISSAMSYIPENFKKFKNYFLRIFLKYKKIKTNFYNEKLLVYNNYKDDIFDLKFYYFKLISEVLIKGINNLNKNFTKIKIPILLLHSKNDLIVSIDHSLNTFKKVSSLKKELIRYEKSYHNIFNDVEKDLIIKDIYDWLLEKT